MGRYGIVIWCSDTTDRDSFAVLTLLNTMNATEDSVYKGGQDV